jgi:hypothetical protein
MSRRSTSQAATPTRAPTASIAKATRLAFSGPTDQVELDSSAAMTMPAIASGSKVMIRVSEPGSRAKTRTVGFP